VMGNHVRRRCRALAGPRARWASDVMPFPWRSLIRGALLRQPPRSAAGSISATAAASR
jgi:hypothetical protein